MQVFAVVCIILYVSFIPTSANSAITDDHLPYIYWSATSIFEFSLTYFPTVIYLGQNQWQENLSFRKVSISQVYLGKTVKCDCSCSPYHHVCFKHIVNLGEMYINYWTFFGTNHGEHNPLIQCQSFSLFQLDPLLVKAFHGIPYEKTNKY